MSYLNKNVFFNCDCSEFCENSYDRSDLIVLFKTTLEKKYRNSKEKTESIINSVFSNSNITILPKKYSASDQEIHYMPTLDCCKNDAKNDVEAYIEVSKYIQKYIEIQKKFIAELNKGYLINDFTDEYLDSFLYIFVNVVFNPDNSNLYNVSFRKSSFLNDLITSCAKYSICNKSSSEYGEYYLFDPFVYDSIQRIVQNINYFHVQNQSSILFDLKEEIFLRKAERLFNRFIYHNNKTFRISLNRHDSKLLACEYNNLSSIEEIKPIRLFEKIAAYIRKNYASKKDKILTIQICIIGHTEPDHNGKESEISDLLTALLDWYDKSKFKDNEHKLNLKIENIVSQNDWPEQNYKYKRDKIEEKINDNMAACIITKVDYTETFSYHTKILSEKIKQNDIVFLLDCPWLITENFEIKNTGSLNYFCEHLKDQSRRTFGNNDKYFITKPDWLDSSIPTVMKNINSQLNRIMATNTTNAGNIIRVFRNDLIKKIQKIVERQINTSSKDHLTTNNKKANNKELYIFCSESESINYSSAASYPLTRTESYEGKVMSILKFDNYKNDCLPYNDSENLIFKIRLWSVLKYVSVSFAYNEFKNIIIKCFGNIKIPPYSFFEIYRDIFIVLKVSSDLKKIHVGVSFSDRLNNTILALNDELNDEKCRRIKNKLFYEVKDFAKALYFNVIFRSSDGFGDQSIRNSFMMNIYSAVSNVHQMLFWHKYRMAYNNNDYREFEISLEETQDVTVCDSEFDKDFFMDKRVYDLTLLFFEYNSSISLGIKAMLYAASDVFACETGYVHNFFTSIKKVLEESDMMDTTLYQNISCIMEENNFG